MHAPICAHSLSQTADVDSAAAAVRSALESESQLKDFRFMSDVRHAPLDSLPKIVNSIMLRRAESAIKAALTPPSSPQIMSLQSSPPQMDIPMI